MLPQKCGSSLNDTRGARRAEVEEKGREGRTVPVTSNGALHFSRLPAFFVMMHWTERSKEQGMKSMSCAASGGAWREDVLILARDCDVVRASCGRAGRWVKGPGFCTERVPV